MDFWIAFRNAIGVALSMSIGLAYGNLGIGIAISLGAINVAFADSSDAYRQRLWRMATATCLSFLAMLVGSLAFNNVYLATAIGTLWAFAAGMMILISVPLAEVFVVSLSLFVICAVHPTPLGEALNLSLLTLAGGLIQIALSLTRLSYSTFNAERRSLAHFYRILAEACRAVHNDDVSPFATTELNALHVAFQSVLRSNSLRSDRFKYLLSQAERIRVSLLMLVPLKKTQAKEVTDYLGAVALTLDKLANRVLKGKGSEEFTAELAQLESAATAFQQNIAVKFQKSFNARMASLNGQLRASIDVLNNLGKNSDGKNEFTSSRKATKPRFRMMSLVELLRANLSMKSTAFRYALRLTVAVAAGEVISHMLHLQRSYWIPLTVILVLKPDYGSTATRASLRVMGTIAGLLFSGLVFQYIDLSPAMQIASAGVLMFLMRWIGTTNYGIFAFLLSNLVVVLFALEGIAPREVIFSRSANTAIGGFLALAIYLVWPANERLLITDSLANLIDSYRRTFRTAVENLCSSDGARNYEHIDGAMVESRIARSNHEAAIVRLSQEAKTDEGEIESLRKINATMNRIIHTTMSLETLESYSRLEPAYGEKLRNLARQIDQAFISIGLYARGVSTAPAALRGLRELHEGLKSEAVTDVEPGAAAESETAAIEHEFDRMVNSVTTLNEQVQRWMELRLVTRS